MNGGLESSLPSPLPLPDIFRPLEIAQEQLRTFPAKISCEPKRDQKVTVGTLEYIVSLGPNCAGHVTFAT